MNETKQTVVSHFEAPHGSLRSYIIGFASCLLLTALAYLTAVTHDVSDRAAIVIIAVLAIVQCLIQLRRFLHLGDEFKPRWKLAVFTVMLSIVLILVIGSLWIMSNLNYRMMHSPAESNKYISGQDGL